MSARSRSANRFRNPADVYTLHVLTEVGVVLSELGGGVPGSARLNETTAGTERKSLWPDGSTPED